MVVQVYGPGVSVPSPCRICSPNLVHSSTSHLPLAHICPSIDLLTSLCAPTCGALLPVLALKSPHTIASWCAAACYSTYDTCSLAPSSLTPLLCISLCGGMYTLTTCTIVLVGSCRLTCYTNSLPTCPTILRCLLTSTAIPPLLPLPLRCSTILYPGILGTWAAWVNQVS